MSHSPAWAAVRAARKARRAADPVVQAKAAAHAEKAAREAKERAA